MPAFADLSPEEQVGASGLSYGLIARATGGRPVLSWSRSGGGRSAPGGFSAYPNDWEIRIRLLFDWEDRFRRVNWADSS